MVNRFDMEQNGVLDPDKLVFTDNSPGPEKIEVVMGRCFPLHGPGGTYDFMPIPVVRKIVYKNSDGATFTQTFGDLIKSENENYKIPTSVIEKHFDPEKQGCKPKNTFVKHEASDGMRDADPLISNKTNSKESENSSNKHQNKIFSDAQVKNLQLQEPAPAVKIGRDDLEHVIGHHEVNAASPKPDIPERINQSRENKVSIKSESHNQETPSLKWQENLPKPVNANHAPIDQTQQENLFSSKPKSHLQETANSTAAQSSQVDQHQSNVTPLQIDSDTIKRISRANSPRFRVKRVENSKPPEMTGREAWEETQKRKAQLREEFFRVPYEECNREAIRSMGARHRSEPRLNSLAKERKKRNSLSEKRVHFNMDDSQLEDIRKWREERRMQATPQCIKTVAKIYSIDAPSNQRKVEYIDSFTTPTPEVPVAVTLVENASVRAKYSRPTDLDSLKGNPSDKESSASFTSPNIAGCSSDSSSQSKGDTEKTEQIAKSPSANGRSISSPGTSLYATFSKPPERKISPPDSYFDYHLTPDQQDAKPPMRSHPQIPPRSISYPKLSDPQFDSQLSHDDSFPDQVQSNVPLKSLCDSTYNHRLTSKLEAQREPIEKQKSHQPSVALQTQNHQRPNSGETQECIASSTVVRSEDLLRPTTSQNPLPLPRVKSLTLRDDSHLQDTPSANSQRDEGASEKSRAFANRRATSLDRATIRKRTAGLPINSGSYLKSPGLILSHLRSPMATSPTHSVLSDKPTDGKTGNAFSPYRPNNTSVVQSKQSGISNPERAKFFNMNNAATANTSEQPSSANIIKSYIYPKRNSVTILQKDPRKIDVGAISKSTGNNSGQNGHHSKHETQHFKPLDSSSNNIHNGFPENNGSQFNKSSKPSFQTSTSKANSEAPRKDSNKENEQNPPSQKTVPNGKGNSVNILMTKGESYSKHRIVLNSHTKSMTPRMTVRKIIVPASSVSGTTKPVPPPASTRSAPSPTPSCASSNCSFGSSGSSSGCFSGSPSPTPTPSPIRVRASRVPTDL